MADISNMNTELVAVFNSFNAYGIVNILCVSTVNSEYWKVTQVESFCRLLFIYLSVSILFCLFTGFGRKINGNIVLYEISFSCRFCVFARTERLYYVNNVLGMVFASFPYRKQNLIPFFYLLFNLHHRERRAAESIGKDFKLYSFFNNYSAEQLFGLIQYCKNFCRRASLFGLFRYFPGNNSVAGNCAFQLSSADKAVFAGNKISNKAESA